MIAVAGGIVADVEGKTLIWTTLVSSNGDGHLYAGDVTRRGISRWIALTKTRRAKSVTL